MKKLTLIMAMTPTGVIGINGNLPWKIAEDMKRFKALTTGHAIIMGRKTWDSIGRRPLPNRTNIIVTRTGVKATNSSDTGFLVATNIDDALKVAYTADVAPFVIGGADIYNQTFDKATNLEVTYVVRREDGIGRFGELDVERKVTRFTFDPQAWADPTWLQAKYGAHPSMWDWRCTKVERAVLERDVEFHSFERRAIT